MILLDGTCVINETMLTGETTPVIKTAVYRKSKAKISRPNQKTCRPNTTSFRARSACTPRP